MVNLHVNEPVTADLRRVSWPAIIAGIVIALIVQLLITMLGAAIGLASITPASGDSADAGALSIGAAVWWAISGIIAAYVGGWVAARASGIPSSGAGLLHGLVTWAATMIVIFLLLSSAVGAVVGGAFSILGGAASAVGQAAGAAAPAVADVAAGPLADVRQEVQAAVAGDDRNAGGEALGSALTRVFTAGEGGAPQARQAAADLLVRQGGMTPEQANAQIDQWQASYNEAVDQAKQAAAEAAEATAKAAATASIYAFIAMLLGAIAGALGGRSGTPRSTQVMSV